MGVSDVVLGLSCPHIKHHQHQRLFVPLKISPIFHFLLSVTGYAVIINIWVIIRHRKTQVRQLAEIWGE